MIPQLKNALEVILATYYREEKKSWEFYAINKKPLDHVFRSLEFLKNYVRGNRRILKSTLSCAGEHEIHFLNEAMNDLKDSLDLDDEQLQWTADTYNKITVCCLHEHPKTREQKEMKKEHPNLNITLDEGKEMILIRIRNMLLSQNF